MCSRVAGGNEPPSVLSDNLHNSISDQKAPAFKAGLLCCRSPSDTPRRQVAHELEVRLGWSRSSPVRYSDAGHDVTERQRRHPCGTALPDWTGALGDQRRTYRRGWAPAPQNAHPWRPGRPASAGLPSQWIRSGLASLLQTCGQFSPDSDLSICTRPRNRARTARDERGAGRQAQGRRRQRH